MKKVLYITTVSRTINAFLVPHIEVLLENGYQVDCACFIDKEIDNNLIKKGVNVFDVPFCRSPLSIGNIKAFKELIKIQKENNYDIVHVHTPIASMYGRLLKVKFKDLKTIYTAHGYHFLKGGPKLGWILYYPIEKVMSKFTDITININSEDYEITKNKLKPKKCYLVKGVGVDLSRYKPLNDEEKQNKKKELNINDDDFVVIMIAELNKNKNQIQLIKAMELLRDRYPKIKALCVGEGYKLEELKGEVIRRGLANNIKFLGFRTDINELINISDIGVLLSYREGLPRNIMELMANKKKVIVTDIRGSRDLIISDKEGSIVSIEDYFNTAKSIESYYLNTELLKYTSKEILKYETKEICKEIKNIYINLN